MFTEYSLWWLIPIFIFAILIAWLIYFYKQKSFSKTQSIILFTLRTLGLLLLLFLLLNPIIRKTTNHEEKPIIVIAQDNSSSIIKTKDSTFYKTTYTNAINTLSKQLSDKFKVEVYTFGLENKKMNLENKKMNLENKKMNLENKKINLEFTEPQTNISSILTNIQEEYFSQNLSAIILATDGINNYGNNPLNQLDNLPCPVYTIAIGDTNKRKDLSISNIRFNEISYTEDICPLEVSIKANKAKNQKTRLSLQHKGKIIFNKEININEEDFNLDITTTFTPEEAGIQSYTLTLTTIENESNIENNRRDFFVKVLDSRKNIAILSAGAHPDISAIKQSISKNKNYQTTNITDLKATQELSNTNLVIAHQLPYDNNSYQILKNLQNSHTPILYIIGKRTDFNLFNKLNTGLEINVYNKNTQSPATARADKNFSLFSISEETLDFLSTLPPLTTPLARYSCSPALQTLVFQNHNSLKTDYPLISFNNNADNKSAIICGEDIWKWRLRNYMHNQNTDAVDEILQKTIQYLVSDKDKSTFKIKHENIYNQSQKIRLEAEVYNQAYQLINTSDVKISLKNEKGDKYDYTFSKTHNAYLLDISELPAGKYTYSAHTNVGNTDYKSTGSFIVSANELEAIDLVAKHDLLYTISLKTNGKMIYPQEVEQLSKLIEKQKDAKPVIREITTNHKLLNSIWYWLIIILCFSSEWFLRKYWGKI